MSSVADLALATISQAQRRVEIAAQNLANVTTPGYKRRLAFSTLVQRDATTVAAMPSTETVSDFRIGKMMRTGNTTDFAIAGPGYFAVRSENGMIYTRAGQLTRDRNGRVVDAGGNALQLVGGNDLIVKSSKFEVRNDGTVVEGGVSIGQIAVFLPADDKSLRPVTGGFRAADAELIVAKDVTIQQGMIETSNVSTGDEMVVMMEALRRAESGQRMMNVYDDLMGRVITSFGDSVR